MGDIGPAESIKPQLRDSDVVPATTPLGTLRQVFGPRLTYYAWLGCSSRSFTPDDMEQAISAALEWATDKDLSHKPGRYVAKGVRNAVWETVRKAGPGHFARLRTAEGKREWEEQLEIVSVGLGLGTDDDDDIMGDSRYLPDPMAPDDTRRLVVGFGLAAIAETDPIGAEALRLHYMHGMPWAEVADDLGLSEPTARRKGSEAFTVIAGEHRAHGRITHQRRRLRKDPQGGCGRA